MFRTATTRATSYQAIELAHALIAPLRWGAQGLKYQLESPLNPFGHTLLGRNMAAGCELFENVTRQYGKPEFGVVTTRVHGQPVAVREEIVLAKPFCDLRHFARDEAPADTRHDPKVLLIAPLSGHHATLLRDTVAAMLPEPCLRRCGKHRLRVFRDFAEPFVGEGERALRTRCPHGGNCRTLAGKATETEAVVWTEQFKNALTSLARQRMEKRLPNALLPVPAVQAIQFWEDRTALTRRKHLQYATEKEGGRRR